MSVKYEGPGGLYGLFIAARRAKRATWRLVRWPFAAGFIVIAVVQLFTGGMIDEDKPWETEYTYGTPR